MTYNSLNKTNILPAALIMASLVLTPLVSSAQVGEREERTRDNKFCSSLDEIETKIISTLTDRLGKAKDKYDTHLDTLAGKKDAAVERVTTKRGEVDVKFELKINEMLGKAKTDAQKAAISTYQAEVEGLVEVRRAAVNTAVKAFTDGMTGLRDTRSADYSAMIATHKAGMEAAFDSAQAACDGGTESATVRSELRTALETEREEFKTARKDYSNRGNFEELRKTRMSVTEAARQTFRAGLSAANQKLRAALVVRP